MKYFKDAMGAVWAFDADGSQDDLITDDMVSITEAEADSIRFPAPDFATQKVERLRRVDAAIVAEEGTTDRALRELVPSTSPSYARMQRIESVVATIRTKRASIVSATTQEQLDAVDLP